MTQFYFYLLNHPSFQIIQALTDDLYLFFKNYVEIKRLMKIAIVVIIQSSEHSDSFIIDELDPKKKRKEGFKYSFTSMPNYLEYFKKNDKRKSNYLKSFTN